MTKEKDKGKRELPPTPPIEKRETEKESNPNAILPGARARACEAGLVPPVIDVKTPPSLKLLLAYAHHRIGFFDDAFTREWHRIMTDELFWCNPETGRPICHWPAYFRVWRANRRFFDKLRDPDRIPDARTVGSRGRKADNWRGTRKEDIGNALG